MSYGCCSYLLYLDRRHLARARSCIFFRMAKASSSSPQPKSKPAAKRTWKARTPAQKRKKREREAAARARGELDRSLKAWRDKLSKQKENYHDKKPSARYNKETKCSKGERLDDYVQYKCALKDARKQARDAQRECEAAQRACEAKDQLFKDLKAFVRSQGGGMVIDSFLNFRGLPLY